MTDATSLWTSDAAIHRVETRTTDLLKRATSAAHRHPFHLVRDFVRLARGPGRLSFKEYVDYRLYDRELHPDHDARLRFITDRLHWKLCYQCSSPAWNATTECKWIAETLLRNAGLPTTRTRAMVGGQRRGYGKTPWFGDEEGFLRFGESIDRPLFAKVNGGLGSEGATRIDPLGDGRFDVAGVGTGDAAMVYRTLAAAKYTYLLQDVLVQHPEMTAMTGPSIATIRAVSFVIDGVPHTPITVIKLPTGSNVADNYWRDGNLVADVDENTGEIRRVVRGTGPETELLDCHPDTQARLVGQVLPDWSGVRDLIRAVGELYAPVKYQSLDIALTETGPAVVEINTGGSFMLPQVAKGAGLLTDEMIDLFRRAGAEIDTRKLAGHIK